MRMIIGFSSGRGWFSKVIRWFTTKFGKQPVETTHTYVRVEWDELDADVIFGADSVGIVPQMYDDFVAKNDVVDEFEVLEADGGAVMRQVIQNGWVGHPYGYWNAGVTGLRKLFGNAVRGLATQSPKQMICTEFSLRVLKLAGAGLDFDVETTHCPEMMAAMRTDPRFRSLL